MQDRGKVADLTFPIDYVYYSDYIMRGAPRQLQQSIKPSRDSSRCRALYNGIGHIP